MKEHRDTQTMEWPYPVNYGKENEVAVMSWLSAVA